jgi:RNA polymerase sigma factor (sigma-70 family)
MLSNLRPFIRECVAQLRDPLIYQARAYLGRAHGGDAEDVVQEAFIDLADNLSRGRVNCLKGIAGLGPDALEEPGVKQQLRSYLGTIVRRRCGKVRSREAVQAGWDEDVLDSGAGPFRAAEVSEEQALVQAAVQELAEEYRLVIVMHFFEAKTIKQIAELLEIPQGTVKSRIARGKVALRKKLDGPSTDGLLWRMNNDG